MEYRTWDLDYPAVLHVEVSAKADSPFWTFTEEIKEKIQDAIEEAMHEPAIPTMNFDGMIVKVEGASVLPLRHGDR